MSAAAGEPALVLVEGEAGTGKSWLVQWLLALPEAQALSRLIVRFTASGTAVVRELTRRPGACPDGSTEAVAQSTGHAAVKPASHTTTEAVVPALSSPSVPSELVDLLGSGTPMVLVAEDLHRADESARAVLRRLLERPPAGLCAVLTYRPEELATPGLVLGAPVDYPADLALLRTPLGPLAESQVRQLAMAALGESRCTAEFVFRLWERTGGVAEVVVDALREGGDGRCRPERDTAGAADGLSASRLTTRDADRLPVPVRLAELVRGRTAALDPRHQPVVWAAAVLGEAAAEEELLTVAGLPQNCGRPALLAALRSAALHELGPYRYGFRVPMAADAVQELLPGPIRRELHSRAAEVLARRQPVPWSELARHQLASGQPAAWLDSMKTAAEQAAENGQHKRAIALLEEALAHSTVPQPTRARLALALARSAVVGLPTDQTVEVLRKVVEDRDLAAADRGEIRLDLGLLLSNQAGKAVEGRCELLKAAAELGGRPALAARAMCALAMPYWPGGSLEENLAWLGRAEAAAADSGDPVVQAAVAANRVSALMSMGSPEAWRLVDELPRDGQDLRCRQHFARGLCNAGDAAVWLGEHVGAAELLTEALQLAVKTGASYAEQNARSALLRLEWATGRWTGLSAKARALVTEAGEMPLVAADAHLVLGALALARGEWGRMPTWLADAATSGHDGAIPLVAAVSGLRIRLLRARGDVAAAIGEAVGTWARVKEKALWVCAAELAPWAVEVCACAAERDTAQAMTAEFAAGLAGRQAPMATAALAWCRAVLAETGGEPAAAAKGFGHARALYRELPRPYEAALAAEATGRCLLAADALSDAGRSELLTAQRELESLGAAWDAARVRSELRHHRTRERPPPGRPGYGERLSPREREVALLAGAGLTNREIAITLHLSPRTVESHVARTMRKLGVLSRQDLARIEHTDHGAELTSLARLKTGDRHSPPGPCGETSRRLRWSMTGVRPLAPAGGRAALRTPKCRAVRRRTCDPPARHGPCTRLCFACPDGVAFTPRG